MTMLAGQRVGRRRNRPRELEDQLQVSIAHFLAGALGPEVLWFHVPNGGKRGKTEAGRFKAMGVKAGVPDLVFVYRGNAFFIELKTGTGSLSTAQRAMMSQIAHAGANMAVCRSMAAVEGTLRGWGFPLRARVVG